MTDPEYVRLLSFVGVLLFVVALCTVVLWLDKRRWKSAGRFKPWAEVEHLVLNGQGILIVEADRVVRWCPEVLEDPDDIAEAFHVRAFATDCPSRLRSLQRLRDVFPEGRVFAKTREVIF